MRGAQAEVVLMPGYFTVFGMLLSTSSPITGDLDFTTISEYFNISFRKLKSNHREISLSDRFHTLSTVSGSL